MKTFKIVALQIVDDHLETKNIPLTDGLIINKENEEGSWIIEAYVDNRFQSYFESIHEKGEPFEIRVIITHAANDPAPFTVSIHSIKQVKDHISVLFIGRLSKRRNEYLELLLADLIKEGLSGEELLKEFRARIRIKQPVSKE
ncbi:YwpF-like family protein [Siminovitchia fordii]|uniref:YwpF-like family protein n=1 Tax=Siminovitchia fordii TaxID=254759 RepID=UPI00037FA516|nr:YwpF-like family protein [Siminovitchia fordii]